MMVNPGGRVMLAAWADETTLEIDAATEPVARVALGAEAETDEAAVDRQRESMYQQRCGEKALDCGREEVGSYRRQKEQRKRRSRWRHRCFGPRHRAGWRTATVRARRERSGSSGRGTWPWCLRSERRRVAELGRRWLCPGACVGTAAGGSAHERVYSWWWRGL